MHFPLPVVTTLIMLLILSVMLWPAYRKKFSCKRSWLLFFSGSALVFIFIFFAGTWAFTSIYLRWLFLGLFAGGVAYSYYKHKHLPYRSDLPLSIWFTVGRTIILIIGAFLVYMYADSNYHDGQAVRIGFPFKNGTFYMMQGGSNRLSNFFHSGFSKKGYGYAMDIAELNHWGNRARHIYSDNLNDYEIYNDTIYSPCDGNVLTLVDGVDDNLPGRLNVKQVHGNHMVIQGNGYRIFMAHLKKGKIFVQQGDKIKQGQPIGLQGNAGFTVEPHLHPNVLVDYADDDVYSGISVPAVFNGEFYTLNEIIQN